MTKMTRVRLIGKTRKGKTRIGTSGPIWEILEGPKTPLCCDSPALLLSSLDGRDWRWVQLENDENFTVEVLL